MTISWGHLIALVFPGTVVVYSFQYLSPRIAKLLSNPGALTTSAGVTLLLLAALAGGVIEAVRLLTIDQALARRYSWPPIYEFLTSDNLAVFEAGVENSFRYYAFYSNLGLALILAFVVRATTGKSQWEDLFALATAVVLLVAAVVQYRNFSGFAAGFVESAKQQRTKEEDRTC